MLEQAVGYGIIAGYFILIAGVATLLWRDS